MSIRTYERDLHDAKMLMSHVVIQEHCSKTELSLQLNLKPGGQRSAVGMLFIFKVAD